MTNPADEDRILRLPEVLQKTGISETTQWRLERAGKFPRRVNLGGRMVGWRLSEIHAWMAERTAA
ncbi:MAG TPA: AlpA family transcriptional regulator [Planctomycetota bacterium]|nr:AlpA family transcriptional regulator [Planctomycetota bacterium]